VHKKDGLVAISEQSSAFLVTPLTEPFARNVANYLPFGEEIPSSIGARGGVMGYGGADSTKQKFTQKERDSESGLDYFLARYYSAAQGRFTSVDPLTASAAKGTPQSWNRFTYGVNNPLRFVDIDGLAPGDFYDQEGKKLGTDGVTDQKIYVVTDKSDERRNAGLYSYPLCPSSEGSGAFCADLEI
jgi:RHS repeat-associated protein